MIYRKIAMQIIKLQQIRRSVTVERRASANPEKVHAPVALRICFALTRAPVARDQDLAQTGNHR